jgi:hypothetical protein
MAARKTAAKKPATTPRKGPSAALVKSRKETDAVKKGKAALQKRYNALRKGVSGAGIQRAGAAAVGAGAGTALARFLNAKAHATSGDGLITKLRNKRAAAGVAAGLGVAILLGEKQIPKGMPKAQILDAALGLTQPFVVRLVDAFYDKKEDDERMAAMGGDQGPPAPAGQQQVQGFNPAYLAAPYFNGGASRRDQALASRRRR